MLDKLYEHRLADQLLYFKTNSELGSGEKTVIWYYLSESMSAGGIGLWFKTSTLRVFYNIHACTSYAALPKQPSEKRDKVWILKKRGYRTELWCNGELLLDFTASSETCEDDEDLETKLAREVEHIRFPLQHDTATDKFSTGMIDRYSYA